jgi:hypothetical protein
MTVHPACIPIATTIASLETQRGVVRSSLPGLGPLDTWKALAQIGDLTRQIADAQVQLDDCQRLHAVLYEAEVVIFDTTGGPPATREASLWQLDGSSPILLEKAPVTAAGLAFVTASPEGALGITIAETGNPAVQGVDFRSGHLEELPRKSPGDPSGRLEIVVGPTLTFDLDELRGWLGTVPLPSHTTTPITSGPFTGEVDITVATLGVALATNRIRLTAAGTAGVSGPLLGSQVAPFSIEVPLRLGLPLAPGGDYGCNVQLAGTPSLTVGGQLGAVLNPMAQFFFDLAGGLVLPVLRDRINEALPPAIALIFGLDDTERVPVISLRRFEITPTAVTIQPTLGAFGDVLSTFKP